MNNSLSIDDNPEVGMNKRVIRKLGLCSLYLSLVVILLLSVGKSGLALDKSTLRGKPFTDPSQVMEVNPDDALKSISRGSDGKDVDLVVDLNQQLFPFLGPVIEEYARQNALKITISEGTCGKSAGKISKKEVDIGGFCCPPAVMDRLPGIKYHTLGISPLAFLVSAKNPVENLSLDQLRKVFQGEILNWSEIGGQDKPIKVIGSLHCAKRPGHWRLLLDNEDLFGPRFTNVGEMADNIAMVVKDVGVISYETLNVARRFQDKSKWKGLHVNGHDPDDLTALLKGYYSIYRVFNVTTWSGKNVENPQAILLVRHLMEYVAKTGKDAGLISAAKLKEAGWKFKDDELIGEPY